MGGNSKNKVIPVWQFVISQSVTILVVLLTGILTCWQISRKLELTHKHTLEELKYELQLGSREELYGHLSEYFAEKENYYRSVQSELRGLYSGCLISGKGAEYIVRHFMEYDSGEQIDTLGDLGKKSDYYASIIRRHFGDSLSKSFAEFDPILDKALSKFKWPLLDTLFLKDWGAGAIDKEKALNKVQKASEEFSREAERYHALKEDFLGRIIDLISDK